MPQKLKSTPVWGQVHLSRRQYGNWAATLAAFAKTPRQLPRPKADLSDLELVAALIPDLRQDLQALWAAFTTDRAEVARYLMDPKKEALVYLLGFHLANQARTQGVLHRLEQRTGLLSYLAGRPSLRLVDLGSGTGALSQTTAGELILQRPELAVEIELVDKSQAFLDLAVHGLRGLLGAGQPIVTRRQKLDQYLGLELEKRADPGPVWYQLGYVWNEIAAQPRTAQWLLRFLDQGLQQGARTITLIEPANQDLARGAMQWREQLVEMGYRVLYPCPHSDSCPMLERSRDWCYSEFAWDRPPLMKTIDRILEIDRQRIGCSAYVLVSPDIEQALQAKRVREEQEIVVGRPQLPRGRRPLRDFEYLLCTTEGLAKRKPGDGPELFRGQSWEKPVSATSRPGSPSPSALPAQAQAAVAKKKESGSGRRPGSKKAPKGRALAAKQGVARKSPERQGRAVRTKPDDKSTRRTRKKTDENP